MYMYDVEVFEVSRIKAYGRFLASQSIQPSVASVLLIVCFQQGGMDAPVIPGKGIGYDWT